MQVSDLMGQYHQASQPTKITKSPSVKQLVSSLKEMSAGNIFEGTVNSVKNGQVTLALSNGQQITARLDGKVPMSVGQSMFFQVKSNDGTQIAIRPFTVDGNSANLTLMEALNTAGIPVDGRNLSMVNVMMEEQMSIDRNSLSQMARIVQGNPDLDVKTLVQMQKLNLPITPEMVSQYQNYAEDKQAIHQKMTNFISELSDWMASDHLPQEQMQKMGSEIISIMIEELPVRPQPDAEAFGTLQEQQKVNPVPEEAQQIEQTQSEAQPSKEVLSEAVLPEEEASAAAEGLKNIEGQISENVRPQETDGKGTVPKEQPLHTLGSILSGEQIQELNEQLNAVMSRGNDGEQQSGVHLNRFDSTVAVLRQVQEKLEYGGTLDKDLLSRLFSNEGFQELLQDAMEQQWMVRPENLAKDYKIHKLYERMEDQLERLENLTKISGQDTSVISRLAADIRSNVEFMNQVNQAYTYVQIPLKMSGQSASGELYVYTNKKNLREGTDDLTAFLHLDMDHLGSTDVSVRMHGKEVFTKFYFEDDATYDLVESHIGELNERLQAKGYHSTVTVVNDSKSVDFVEDFLKKDQPTTGMVHRYSFDMRA